jgi:hypothetical protein
MHTTSSSASQATTRFQSGGDDLLDSEAVTESMVLQDSPCVSARTHSGARTGEL